MPHTTLQRPCASSSQRLAPTAMPSCRHTDSHHHQPRQPSRRMPPPPQHWISQTLARMRRRPSSHSCTSPPRPRRRRCRAGLITITGTTTVARGRSGAQTISVGADAALTRIDGLAAHIVVTSPRARARLHICCAIISAARASGCRAVLQPTHPCAARAVLGGRPCCRRRAACSGPHSQSQRAIAMIRGRAMLSCG